MIATTTFLMRMVRRLRGGGGRQCNEWRCLSDYINLEMHPCGPVSQSKMDGWMDGMAKNREREKNAESSQGEQ